MDARAKLTIVDQRHASRHPADYTAKAQHRKLGEFTIHIRNLSAQGFMIEGDIGLEPGERIQLRLPKMVR